MAGTINVGSITDGVYSIAPEDISKGTAKAWVNYNSQASPLIILKSYNISSIIDNGVGDVTLNFINKMSDDNYCVNTGIMADSGGVVTTLNLVVRGAYNSGPTLKNANQLRLQLATHNALYDAVQNFVSIYDY